MSYPSIRPWAGALAALVVLFVTQQALPLAAATQQPLPGAETQPILQGVVVDESNGQPIESATVSLVGTDIETQTGRYGGFAFPDVQPGLVSVHVTAPGHPSVVQEVEVKRDGIVFVRFDLPSIAAVLAELLGDDEPMAGVLTAADLVAIEVPSARLIPQRVARNTNEEIRPRWVGEMPTLIPGARAAFPGQDDDQQGDSRFTSSTQSLEPLFDLEPLVFIDGVRVGLGQAFEALSQIPASYVEDIEVLRRLAATARYPMAEDGVVVVVVKTRSGGGR